MTQQNFLVIPIPIFLKQELISDLHARTSYLFSIFFSVYCSIYERKGLEVLPNLIDSVVFT